MRPARTPCGRRLRLNRRVVRGAFAVALAAGTAQQSLADTHYWGYASTSAAYWENNFWAMSYGGMATYAPPATLDDAYLWCGWNATVLRNNYTQTHSASSLNYVFILGTGGSTAFLRQDSGSFSTVYMPVGYGGPGIYTHNGGTFSVSTLSVGEYGSFSTYAAGVGTVNMNGGTLTANAISVGTGSSSSGRIYQTTGIVSAGSLNLGNLEYYTDGRYYLQGGTLSVGTANIGKYGYGYVYLSNATSSFAATGSVVLGYGSAAVGAVYQSAGTFSAGSIVVGADGSGTYSLSGGALQTTANQYVGGNYDSGSIGLGTFSHSVGTNTVGQYLFIGNSPGSTGVYSLISGTLHVDVGTAVGELGNAMFIQNGGRHEIIGPLWLGYGPLSSGTYTLNSPGALSSGDSEYIGASGAGTFFHNSGSNTCSVMRIGSGGSGRYLMTSGTLTVTEQIQLGAGSGNWFSHTGGTVDSGTLLFDGGLYTQSGGTLSVATINVNGDPSHYAFNAGTLIIDTLALSPTQALGGQLYLDAPRCVTVNKNLTLPAGSKVTIDGGTLSAGSITNAGADVRLLKGNLRLTGTPPLIVGSTGQFGAALEIPSGFRVDANTTSRVNLNSDGIILISGGTLNCLNGMDMYPGGQLYLDSPAATLSGGTLTLYGGTLSGTGRIASRLTNNGGTIRLESGDHLQFTNADNFTNGTVELLGGVAEFAGSVTNTGAIIGRGTVQAGTLHNINTITFSGGPSEIFGVLQNDLFSRVLVTGGSHSTFYRDVTNVSGSSFKVSQDSIAAFIGDVTGMAAFNGPGTKIFEAGATDGAIVTSGESIVETGGSLSISSIRENALTVRGSAAVLPNGTSTALSRLNVLAIESGSFDLNDNDLIADNTPIGTVKSYLASAYNNGSWNGNGLTSSVAREIAADPTNVHMTALGYAEASAIGVTGFDGQIVGGDSVLVRYTFYGDANLDRKVNALDFNALASNFGNGTGKIWTMGDFNYDGMSNTLDFNAIAINFNQALPSPALGSLIPEPAGCAIFAGAGAICLRRRRQTPA